MINVCLAGPRRQPGRPRGDPERRGAVPAVGPGPDHRGGVEGGPPVPGALGGDRGAQPHHLLLEIRPGPRLGRRLRVCTGRGKILDH